MIGCPLSPITEPRQVPPNLSGLLLLFRCAHWECITEREIYVYSDCVVFHFSHAFVVGCGVLVGVRLYE